MGTRRRMLLLALATGLVLWGATTPAFAYGDWNTNGVIDLDDYAHLAPCLTGPGGGLGAGCDVFDFDSDTDIDVYDFGAFQHIFGTSVPERMVLIPGGSFEMGDPWSEGGVSERPVHTVYLSPYYIDTFEVTNQQYADGLNWAWAQGGLITVTNFIVHQAGSGTSYPYCTTSSIFGSRITWDGSTFGAVPQKEDHPIGQVTWYGAVAYCNWRSAMESKPSCYDLSSWTCNFGAVGYRLPTEAEWEKAAGWDPAQSRHFRFGEHTDGCGYNCLDGQRANYYNSGDPYEVSPYPYTTPVGFYNGELHYKVDFGWPGSATSYQTQDAPSYYGCYDMSGNVWEWCHDWYDEDYYSDPETTAPSPQGPDSGTERVTRGGAWNGPPYYCRSANRGGKTPDYRHISGGLRYALGTP